jgi:hypothetical protein
MNKTNNQRRLLALDLRPRSYGYAVLEGPDRLLDWGVRSFRNGVNAVQAPMRKKLANLLDELAPSVVVAKDLSKRRGITGRKLRKITEVLRREAGKRAIPVRFLNARALQAAFGSGNRLTKHAIASALAQRFPELSWRLPPKRKPWQSEDYRISIFDAAALGVAYFARRAKQTSAVLDSDPAPP